MLRAAICLGALLLTTATPASAQLIDLGNGMVYDPVQDLTWLRDARYAGSSGYDDDGWMLQSESILWAANLEFGGFDDWRLPLFLGGGDLDYSSELSILLTQLGWHWGPVWGDVVVGDAGPFLNFYAEGINMYWLGNQTSLIWHELLAYDVRDVADGVAGAWAVRAGYPHPRLAQPTTTADCKNGGWHNLVREDLTPFSQQGDCVSYVSSRK